MKKREEREGEIKKGKGGGEGELERSGGVESIREEVEGKQKQQVRGAGPRDSVPPHTPSPADHHHHPPDPRPPHPRPAGWCRSVILQLVCHFTKKLN